MKTFKYNFLPFCSLNYYYITNLKYHSFIYSTIHLCIQQSILSIDWFKTLKGIMVFEHPQSQNRYFSYNCWHFAPLHREVLYLPPTPQLRIPFEFKKKNSFPQTAQFMSQLTIFFFLFARCIKIKKLPKSHLKNSRMRSRVPI